MRARVRGRLMIKRNRVKGGFLSSSIKLRKSSERGFIFSEKRLLRFEKWWEALWWQTFYQTLKTLFSFTHTRGCVRGHTRTHAHASFGSGSRPGSIRALCCWQCWRPQHRQLWHSSSLHPSPFHSHCSACWFCAWQITVLPASLAASQTQAEKTQACLMSTCHNRGYRDIWVGQYRPWTH